MKRFSRSSIAAAAALVALLAAWPASEGGGRLLSSRPWLYYDEHFLSPAEVQSVLALLPEANLTACVEKDRWQGTWSDHRKCGMLRVEAQPSMQSLLDKVALVWPCDISGITHIPVRLTPPNSSAVPSHLDLYNDADKARLNRTYPDALVFVYLTDGPDDEEAGGRVVFHANGLRVPTRAGAMLTFASVDPTGKSDPAAMHEVEAYSAAAQSDRVMLSIPLLVGREASAGPRGPRGEATAGLAQTAQTQTMRSTGELTKNFQTALIQAETIAGLTQAETIETQEDTGPTSVAIAIEADQLAFQSSSGNSLLGIPADPSVAETTEPVAFEPQQFLAKAPVKTADPADQAVVYGGEAMKESMCGGLECECSTDKLARLRSLLFAPAASLCPKVCCV